MTNRWGAIKAVLARCMPLARMSRRAAVAVLSGIRSTLTREPVGIIALVFTVWQLSLYMGELDQQQETRTREAALRERTLAEMDAERELREGTLYVMLSERLEAARCDARHDSGRPQVGLVQLLERMVRLGISLARIDASGCSLQTAVLVGADLNGASLQGTFLDEAILEEAQLWGADLKGAKLVRARLGEARFWEADFTGATLTRANLIKADLRQSKLVDANLSTAFLARADLRGARLTGADLGDASLAFADLTGADLTGANLRGADLADAKLEGSTGLTQLQLDSTCISEHIVDDDSAMLPPRSVPDGLVWTYQECELSRRFGGRIQ